MHGHTYGGNPLACAAGLAVQDYMRAHRLIERSAELGPYLLQRAGRLRELPSVGDVRGGRGLFLGIELVEDRAERRPYPRQRRLAETVVEAGLDHGITLFAGGGGDRGHAGDCVIVAPPFVITPEQIDEAVDLLEASIAEAEVRAGIRTDELAPR
jgi:adenosylmethionine-8-amino-7-oxononanoate aminotransferase